MPRMTALHMLRSTISTVSAPANSSFRGSITHPTQPLCTLRVRRRRRLTQHSLPGGLLGLTWAGLTPADRASFAGAFASFDHLVGTDRASSCSPRVRAAACVSLDRVSAEGLVGLTSSAMAVAPGTNSCASSNSFAPSSTDKRVTPVRLPPGRLRLATRPSLTGSAHVTKMTGTVMVALLAARAALWLPTTTATLRLIRLATRAGNRSTRSSAGAKFNADVLAFDEFPHFLQALTERGHEGGVASASDVLRRKPTTGIAGCCARDASSHAVSAPPRSLINSRRRTKSPSEKADNLAHYCTTGALCIAAQSSCICWFRVKTRTPCQRSHVSFRQLRAIHRTCSGVLCARVWAILPVSRRPRHRPPTPLTGIRYFG